MCATAKAEIVEVGRKDGKPEFELKGAPKDGKARLEALFWVSPHIKPQIEWEPVLKKFTS
jgi:hypothetical protein